MSIFEIFEKKKWDFFLNSFVLAESSTTAKLLFWAGNENETEFSGRSLAFCLSYIKWSYTIGIWWKWEGYKNLLLKKGHSILHLKLPYNLIFKKNVETVARIKNALEH